MDTQQIILTLPSLSLENLQQLSKAIQSEMNPSFEKLAAWENQSSDRKFEWLVHQVENPNGCMYYVALVFFHDGLTELYRGNSSEEILAKRIALRSALCNMTIELDVEKNLDRAPTPISSDSDSDCDCDCGPNSDCEYCDRDFDCESGSDDKLPKPKETVKKVRAEDVDKVYKLGEISPIPEFNCMLSKPEPLACPNRTKKYFETLEFYGKTPLGAAKKFFESLTDFDSDYGTYTFSLILKEPGEWGGFVRENRKGLEKDTKFFFRGTSNITSNSVSPQMKWNEEKKIYTDGEFVYTSLEKVYARLLKNEKLRPLTNFETTVLANRGIQYIKVDNMKGIYALRDLQCSSDKSSSEDEEESSESKDEDEEPDSEEEKIRQVHWCPKYKLYTDGKFVYDGSKKVFGRLCNKGSPYGDGVRPLDIADIRTLKEAEIRMVNNFHASKIAMHVQMSRECHEFEVRSDPESSSSEAEEVYPDLE